MNGAPCAQPVCSSSELNVLMGVDSVDATPQAFWMLTWVSDRLCPEYFTVSGVGVDVDALTFGDILSERFPELVELLQRRGTSGPELARHLLPYCFAASGRCVRRDAMPL